MGQGGREERRGERKEGERSRGRGIERKAINKQSDRSNALKKLNRT